VLLELATVILVVLGTWGMPFARPLREIERAAAAGLLPQPIIVQSGCTAYTSPHLQIVPFFSSDEMERMYERAKLVVCQAGVGSIMLGLRKRKTIIAIARRAVHDEHVDDHQLEILDVFSKLRSVLPWKGEGDLPQVLPRAGDFAPAAYPFGEEKISRTILEFLVANVSAGKQDPAEHPTSEPSDVERKSAHQVNKDAAGDRCQLNLRSGVGF
jgi:UDP-N-acetylglucosamine transferase subunit ALG13